MITLNKKAQRENYEVCVCLDSRHLKLDIMLGDGSPLEKRIRFSEGCVYYSDLVPKYDDEKDFMEKVSVFKQPPIVILEKRTVRPSDAHILLLENETYTVLLTDECKRGLKIDCPGVTLRRIPRIIETVMLVSFKNYAGRGCFKIGDFNIDFEVRSSKIEYFVDYPKMISDISSFYTALALYQKSPLSERFTSSPQRSQARYEDYLLVKTMFDEMHLSDSYNYVREHIHETLKAETDVSYCCDAYCIEPGSLIEMISGDCLESNEEYGIIAGGYNPAYVINTNHVETYDNLENRLVKDFLLALYRDLCLIDSDIVSKDTDGFIKDDVKMMIKDVQLMLSDSWLKDVGRLETIPFTSTVLTQKNGYRDIFKMYLMLDTGLRFDVEDARDIINGHLNQISRIYEYWCYTRIFNALSNMGAGPPNIIINDRKKWAVSIKRCRARFKIDFDGEKHDVDLYYNKAVKKHGKLIESYSLKFTPDFTLIVDETQIIHLDAKYKLNRIKQKAKDDDVESDKCAIDIYKMHTYRDAIYRCRASFILYPGDKKQGAADSWYSKEFFDHHNDEDVPCVGSIVLNPSGESTSVFESTLRRLIEFAADWDRRVDSGEFNLHR